MSELQPLSTPLSLRDVPTEQLKAELADALSMSARHLARLAVVWCELERRGEDLSSLRLGLGSYLPLIASGQVMAEVVVMFAGQAQTLRKVAALPVAKQQAIAAGGELPWAQAKPKPQPQPQLHRGTSRFPAPEVRHRDDDDDGPANPDPLAAVRVANPHDAADLIVKAVEGSPDPKALARRLLAELERIVANKPKPLRYEP